MLEGFHQGGWGMYPTTIVGLLLVVAAVQYARRPDRRRLGIVHSLSALTLLTGTLGFVIGVIRSFTSLPGAEPRDVGAWVIVGVGESLNNIALAVMLLTIAAIATVIGKARPGWSASGNGAELADPHVT